MCNHQCLQAQSTQATHTGCHTAVCWMSGTGGGEENGNIAQDNVGCSVLIIYCEDLIEMGHEWTGDICLISQPWLYTLHSALSSSRQRHTIRPMQTYIWCLVEDLRKLLVKQATIIHIQTMSTIWIHINSSMSLTTSHICLVINCHRSSLVTEGGRRSLGNIRGNCIYCIQTDRGLWGAPHCILNICCHPRHWVTLGPVTSCEYENLIQVATP